MKRTRAPRRHPRTGASKESIRKEFERFPIRWVLGVALEECPKPLGPGILWAAPEPAITFGRIAPRKQLLHKGGKP